MTKDEKDEIREIILKELKEVFGSGDKEIAKRISDRLRNVEADIIAKTDPQAADVHRRLNPSF